MNFDNRSRRDDFSFSIDDITMNENNFILVMDFSSCFLLCSKRKPLEFAIYTAVCRIMFDLHFCSSKRPIFRVIGGAEGVVPHPHKGGSKQADTRAFENWSYLFCRVTVLAWRNKNVFLVHFLSFLFSENPVGKTFLFLQNGTGTLQKR